MFKLSELFPYDKLITYQNKNKRNYEAYIKLFKNISQYKYEKAFIGYNTPLYRRLIANIKYNELYYLDTSEHTIVTQEQMYNDNNLSKKNPYKPLKDRKLKERLVSLLYKSRGYQMDTDMKNLKFFTVFHITPYKNEKIVKHNYKYLKKLFSNDINEYKKVLLQLYHTNKNGHIEILNKKRKLDISLKEKSLLSSTGESLEIYPDTIKTIKGYDTRLITHIVSLEKSFLESKLLNDKDLLKTVQNSLIFKDEIICEYIINYMIEIFQKRMIEILSNEDSSSTKRVLGLISTLDEALKIIVEGKNRAKFKIKIDNFYDLFEFIVYYLQQRKSYEDKLVLLDYISSLYINYGKSIVSKKEKTIFSDYLYNNSNIFRSRLIYVLVNVPKEYYKGNSKIYNLSEEIFNKNIQKEIYKKNANNFYKTVLLAHKLNKDLNALCEYFMFKNFKIFNIEEHLDVLSILLDNTSYYINMRDRIWDIYSKATYSREYRIKAGLILVESYYKNKKVAKATKLYFQILKHFGYKNRKEALLYLDIMKLLGVDKTHQDMFEKIYNQHVFGAFLKTNNSEVIIEFLKYQEYLYSREIKEKSTYTKKPINLRYDKSIFKPGDTHILYNNIKEGEEQNIYFVSTPGQMLSAIEAQNHFKTKNNVLVILFFVVRDGKNINQMFKLSELFPYDKLITYQNKSAKFYISFIPFLKIFKEDSFHYLFFGFNTILYRRIVANIKFKELYYLDDGVHTITTHEDTHNDLNNTTRDEYKPFPKTLNFLKVRFIYAKHDLKADTYLNNLNFFTVYNLKQYKNEKIIKHNFSYLRTLLIKNETIDNTVYLLGQPLVEMVGVEQDIYNNHLKIIFKIYSAYKIVYIPHRLEIVHEEIRKYIENNDNIDLFVPNEPIEFYFLNNNIYPMEVVSFITSALFNIRKLFPKTKTKAFEIDIKNLDIHHQKGISLIYKHFSNEDIELISLKEQKKIK
jgi:hypothetical protein